MPVRSTIYIFYMTCCVCICEKGGLGTKKIYIKPAINLHFNVTTSQCRDRPKKKAQITFSPGSHEDSKGRLGSLHHEWTQPQYLDSPKRRPQDNLWAVWQIGEGPTLGTNVPYGHRSPWHLYWAKLFWNRPLSVTLGDPSQGGGSLTAQHPSHHFCTSSLPMLK